MRVGTLVLATIATFAACAPAVDGPRERQRAIDRADADRLGAQLAALPGVVRTEVMLRRAVDDPLSPVASSAGAASAGPAASAVVIVDDRADRTTIARSARVLARAIAPDVAEPIVVVEVGAERPVLATVGPFRVDEHSRTPLRAVLGIAFALVLVLATWVGLREHQRRQRRGSSAQ